MKAQKSDWSFYLMLAGGILGAIMGIVSTRLLIWAFGGTWGMIASIILLCGVSYVGYKVLIE
jgi:hypothetical protein